MVPKTSYSCQDLAYSRQIQCFGRPIIRNGQNYQNRMGIGSIDREFNFPNVQSGSVCDTFQSQTSTLCIPSSGQSSLCDRCILHELEQSSCLCISSNNIDSFCSKQDQSQCRIVLKAPLWPQRPWFSEVLQLLVSAPVRVPLFQKLLTQTKGKFQHQNLPVLDLRVWELSKSFRKFSQNLADLVSTSRRTSTQKVNDAKWIVYICWCHRRKVNPVSAPLTVIADLPFL